MMERNNAEQKAERFLSRADVFAMSIGIMVGWGAFVMPGTTFLPVAGPAGTVIALAIGVLIMLIIVANFTFLMERTPVLVVCIPIPRWLSEEITHFFPPGFSACHI